MLPKGSKLYDPWTGRIGMLCECGKNEATIHEVVIKNGKKFEKHLCEECAAKHGIKTSPQVPTGELLAKYVLSKTVAPIATPRTINL